GGAGKPPCACVGRPAPSLPLPRTRERGRKRRRFDAIRTLMPTRPLRRGWTTGACATAAAKAAYAALLTGAFPDPVEITLPRGERPSFALATTRRDGDSA